MRSDSASELRLMALTRILLSNHHHSVRRGLRAILEATKQHDLCGEASDGSQSLELTTRLIPDILIMDISMPPPNGLDVAAKLRQSGSPTKILFVTMHDSEEMLHTAAAVGASGYLLKTKADEFLIIALQRLEAGQCFVSPSFDPELARQLFNRPRPAE